MKGAPSGVLGEYVSRGPKADRKKLDEYLESVRDIEKRIDRASKEERLEGWRPTLAKPNMPRPADEIPQNGERDRAFELVGHGGIQRSLAGAVNITRKSMRKQAKLLRICAVPRQAHCTTQSSQLARSLSHCEETSTVPRS